MYSNLFSMPAIKTFFRFCLAKRLDLMESGEKT